MPVSPINSKTDLVTIQILISGKEIDASSSIMSIEVEREINRIASARVILLMPQGPSEGSPFKLSESSLFVPGNKIEIKAGYHGEEETIFKGLIVKHGVDFYNNEALKLILDCSDEAIKMTLGRKNKYFKKKKDSDILSAIISDYGLGKEVDATTIEYPLTVQYHVSDWDFLVMRAENNGLLISTENGK